MDEFKIQQLECSLNILESKFRDAESDRHFNQFTIVITICTLSIGVAMSSILNRISSKQSRESISQQMHPSVADSKDSEHNHPCPSPSASPQ